MAIHRLPILFFARLQEFSSALLIHASESELKQKCQDRKCCESLHKTVRRKTPTVMVGNVALGSDHPIRIQTMTTSDTNDVAGTVEEVMRIAYRGADIVRITVQGKKEVDACFEIKDKLVQLNYNMGFKYRVCSILREVKCLESQIDHRSSPRSCVETASSSSLGCEIGEDREEEDSS
ncbi:unnamed protein product [Microthlaspi erraticum]|uniref:IspG TIM-barrel domain-containing protein n=1 Tax=Microthlaspi erraticum TaxID=1685480 RepID=A0A6D2HVJ8_9BRAS|nr:unnamed protein product [Microthlaspi erraticum]CAA7046923.1 unnamed protein product [Microthlaspi erraticum]